jgi:plastocyanin
VSVTVTGKQVTPAPSTINLAVGETLTLTVTSDHADELHIHGFEIEKTLEAGKPLSVTVTGSQPGLYDVETHHPELRLLQIAVR